MDYHRITDETHPALNKIKIIYEEAFPLRERRDFQQLVKLTSINYMRLIAIEDSSTFLGFFIQWEFEKFNYIEHIAIDPLQRGKNYGSTIMKQIIDSNQKTLLLEVEPGEDEISKRRILFYERLGMKLCSFDYKQPPYRKNENSFPMLIMSYSNGLSKELFEDYTSIIKAEVYERWR